MNTYYKQLPGFKVTSNPKNWGINKWRFFVDASNIHTWSVTHFLKTLNLLITIEQWVLELSYCTWAFHVTRSSYWYLDICPCDLDHLWNWPLSGAFVFHVHLVFSSNCPQLTSVYSNFTHIFAFSFLPRFLF